jgi:DNA-binding CsgD family transcriptional regulator
VLNNIIQFVGKRFNAAEAFSATLRPTLQSFGFTDYSCLIWNRRDFVNRRLAIFQASWGSFETFDGPISLEIESLYRDLMEESEPIFWRDGDWPCVANLPGISSSRENRILASLSCGMLRSLSVIQSEPGVVCNFDAIRSLSNICSIICCDLWAREEQKDARSMFTKREIEVLRWFAAGKSSAEAGAIMGVSENTINFHSKNIAATLNTTNRVAAVQWAMAKDVI